MRLDQKLKDFFSYHGKIIAVCILLAIVLTVFYKWDAIKQRYGNESLNSFFQKPQFVAQFYVNLKRSCSDPEEEKWNKENFDDYESPVFCTDAEKDGEANNLSYEVLADITSYDIGYSLDTIFWNNGKINTFEMCDVNTKKISFCKDDLGREWEVFLTDKQKKAVGY